MPLQVWRSRRLLVRHLSSFPLSQLCAILFFLLTKTNCTYVVLSLCTSKGFLHTSAHPHTWTALICAARVYLIDLSTAEVIVRRAVCVCGSLIEEDAAWNIPLSLSGTTSIFLCRGIYLSVCAVY